MSSFCVLFCFLSFGVLCLMLHVSLDSSFWLSLQLSLRFIFLSASAGGGLGKGLSVYNTESLTMDDSGKRFFKLPWCLQVKCFFVDFKKGYAHCCKRLNFSFQPKFLFLFQWRHKSHSPGWHIPPSFLDMDIFNKINFKKSCFKFIIITGSVRPRGGYYPPAWHGSLDILRLKIK